MMKVLLIDDEESALDALEDELREFNDVEIVGGFTNPLQALYTLKNTYVDIVFLDIEMPGRNGIEVAELISQIHSSIEIVFTTAYDQYAVEAFELHALDYLLKPIMSKRLAKTIERCTPKNRSGKTPTSEICCLGTFQLIVRSGQAEQVKWRTNKSRELFAYLFHHQVGGIHKSSIIRDLWPELEEDRALSHLHTNIYYIRRMLKQYGVERPIKVHYANGYYWLGLDGVVCDVDSFQLVTQDASPMKRDNLHQYEQALALYRGDYMGNHDYAWALVRQQELQIGYLDLAKKLSTYYLRNRMYLEALSVLQQAVVIDPLHEEIHTLFLSTYGAMGDLTAMKKHYMKVKELFREELRVEPSGVMENVYRKWSGRHRGNHVI